MTPEERRARLIAALAASPRMLPGGQPADIVPPFVNPAEAAVEAAGRGIDWGNVSGPVPGAGQPSQTPITDAVVAPGAPIAPFAGGTERFLRGLASESTMIPAADRAASAFAEGDPVRGVGAIGEGALMAAPFTRVGRAMFATAPRAVGTGLGMGLAHETAEGRGPINALIPSAEAAEPSEAIKSLQRKLKDAGYYTGPIDGTMTRGGPTEAAKQAFDADQEAKRQREIEAQRLQAEAAKAKALEAEAEARKAETERKRKAAETRTAERQEGAKRLKEIDESLLSRGLNAALAVGPWAGYALGGVLGHRLQRGLAGRADEAARTVAANADAVMARRVAGNDVPGRIGRLNRFWGEGNPGRTEAFRVAPRSARGYVANPEAPPAAELYQPTSLGRAAEWIPVPTVGGIEHVATELGFNQPAQAELIEAQKAVDKDPSEANRQRLQIARAKAATTSLFSRLGLGMGIGSAGHSILHSMRAPRPRPSSLAQAERERGKLIQLLAKPPPKPRARKRKK